jgi:predicted phage terminase large subunit-like protein
MLQDKATQLGWRWKEVAIPALDPVTDQSNWTIYSPDRKPIFTTEYYQNERNLVTAETWAAEFQQEPYEAKGRMFPEEQLNRFTNLPVDMEPDTIIAACDTAGDGSDYCSMPVAYVYGQEVYIVDVVFDDSAPTFTKAECANKLVEHNVKRVTFESNSAGGYFGRDVMELVEANGGRCSARFKYSVANKLTRMENASDNIIKYYYFLDKTCYAAGSQYDTFLKNVVRMTRSGKVSHDDGPDSLALLENEMRNTPKPATVYRHVL